MQGSKSAAESQVCKGMKSFYPGPARPGQALQPNAWNLLRVVRSPDSCSALVQYMCGCAKGDAVGTLPQRGTLRRFHRKLTEKLLLPFALLLLQHILFKPVAYRKGEGIMQD